MTLMIINDATSATLLIVASLRHLRSSLMIVTYYRNVFIVQVTEGNGPS